MKTEVMKSLVDELAGKAAAAHDPADAMRLSQAACNLANTMCALDSIGSPKGLDDGILIADISDEQVNHMVHRFLCWVLPEDFNPDGGISFKKTFNDGTPYASKHNPQGTNLFSATQAMAMVRFMIEDMPVE